MYIQGSLPATQGGFYTIPSGFTSQIKVLKFHNSSGVLTGPIQIVLEEPTGNPVVIETLNLDSGESIEIFPSYPFEISDDTVTGGNLKTLAGGASNNVINYSIHGIETDNPNFTTIATYGYANVIAQDIKYTNPGGGITSEVKSIRLHNNGSQGVQTVNIYVEQPVGNILRFDTFILNPEESVEVAPSYPIELTNGGQIRIDATFSGVISYSILGRELT